MGGVAREEEAEGERIPRAELGSSPRQEHGGLHGGGSPAHAHLSVEVLRHFTTDKMHLFSIQTEERTPTHEKGEAM